MIKLRKKNTVAILAGVAVAQNPAPSAAMAKRGPAAADTNGDGIVTRTDLVAALARRLALEEG